MNCFRVKAFDFYENQEVIKPFFKVTGIPYLISDRDHCDPDDIKAGEEYAITCLDYEKDFRANFESIYYFQFKPAKKAINLISPGEVLTIVKPLDLETLRYTTLSEYAVYIFLYIKPKGSIDEVSKYIDDYIKENGYYGDYRFNAADLMDIAEKSEITVCLDSKGGYLVLADTDSKYIQGLYGLISSYHGSDLIKWIDYSEKTLDSYLGRGDEFD